MKKTKKDALRKKALAKTRWLLNTKNLDVSPIQGKAKLIGLLVVAGLCSLSASCKKESPDTYECQDHQNLTFDTEIHPILEVNCMTGSCHGKFDDYDYVKKYVDNDKLLGSIQHKKGYSPMPKDEPQLPDSLIVKISCWIQHGAPKN